MSYTRPTFHESWYRVAQLRPSLHPMTQIVCQTFRGRRWYVLHDPIADAYHRMSGPAYRFVGLLDSMRTVEEAWRICADRDGDEAPTQGEAIRVLGQLAAANLLRGDLPPDANAIIRRSGKRRASERTARAHSFLFLRLPLWDPDRWLDKWTPLGALVWSRFSLVPWLLLLLAGVWFVSPRTERFAGEAASVLETNNLLLLYGAFVIAKLAHELAHASSCKALLHKAGLRGGVHQIGIMLLVMIPMPYVDASSATALPDRAHRIVVASAGMIVELALAAIAAIVWSITAEHTTLHAFSYNLMFVGSVSTLLFNINPLLRYDGYYILSDLLGIANLAQRSREMIRHLAKRFAWDVRSSKPPTSIPSEQSQLLTYGVASTVYRIAVLVGIIFFVAQQLFVVGLILALGATAVWLIWPLCKFVSYLSTSPELMSRRPRAVVTTAATLAVLVVFATGVRLPDTRTVSAVVEPANWTAVRALEDGTIVQSANRGVVSVHTVALVELSNDQVDANLEALRARSVQANFRATLAETESPATAAIAKDRLASINAALERARSRQADLTIYPPYAGTWEPDESLLDAGAYLERGQVVGTLFSPENMELVAVTNQSAIAHLASSDSIAAKCRALAAPDRVFHAELRSVANAVDVNDTERSHEIGFVLRFTPDGDTELRPGQTVRIRIALPSRSLYARLRDWYSNSIRTELNV